MAGGVEFPVIEPRRGIRPNLNLIRRFLEQHPGETALAAQRYARILERWAAEERTTAEERMVDSPAAPPLAQEGDPGVPSGSPRDAAARGGSLVLHRHRGSTVDHAGGSGERGCLEGNGLLRALLSPPRHPRDGFDQAAAPRRRPDEASCADLNPRTRRDARWRRSPSSTCRCGGRKPTARSSLESGKSPWARPISSNRPRAIRSVARPPSPRSRGRARGAPRPDGAGRLPQGAVGIPPSQMAIFGALPAAGASHPPAGGNGDDRRRVPDRAIEKTNRALGAQDQVDYSGVMMTRQTSIVCARSSNR